MIPKININSQFPTIHSNSINTQMHSEFMNNHKHLNRPIPDNIDSLLLVHRRKMQRRDANRRSAQLSRARKKVN